MRLPVIAIVGRPNVGKSSLLNALARKRISIVQDMPGVTRDRISTPVKVGTQHGTRYVELVDTGGFGFDGDDLVGHVEEQIRLAVGRADMVFFVIDAHDGLTALDETIAEMLRKTGVKVVLVANKADGPRHELTIAEAASLGFGTPVPVSATTGRGVEKFPKLIADNVDLVDAPDSVPEPDLHIAVVGKRNAGKSTFVNAVADLYGAGESSRVIVSEIPGTTRDSVDVRFEKDGRALTIIDTAGVRKRRHMVNDDIEFYAYHRAERSIRRADVVLMLLDSSIKVADPDKKLGRVIADHSKPTIIVVNKWDLARKFLRESAGKQGESVEKNDDRLLMAQFKTYLEKELPGLAHCPVAFTTAQEGKNVGPVLDLARRLFKQSGERVGTGKLNSVIKAAVQTRPPGTRGKRPKIYYATQVDIHPPTIVLFVNDPKLFSKAYQRFLLNRLRDELPFGEVPVQLFLRGKPDREAQAENLTELTGGEKSERKRTGKKPGSPTGRPQKPQKRTRSR
ncbi:MAG: ribosome biogenesis GTPase Der [Planctomycetota bacterium]